MDIKSLTTHKESFNTIRIALLLVIGLSVIGNIGLNYYYQNLIKDNNNVIYIASSDGNMSQGKRWDNITVDDYAIMIEDHVKDFYTLFFQFDENSFQDNMKKGLNLIGSSGETLVEDYMRDQTLNRLKENSAKIEIVEIDVKVKINNINDIKVQVKAIQKSSIGDRYILRRMDSNIFSIRRITRSSLNPHGLLIDDFRIINKEKVTE